MRRTSDGGMVDRATKIEHSEPEFTLTDKELEDIKDWQVGEKYEISLEVEMIGHNKGGIMTESKTHEARFKILKAETDEEEDAEEEEGEGENETEKD
jgi:hypothetical protein